jgi:hypothetical protein
MIIPKYEDGGYCLVAPIVVTTAATFVADLMTATNCNG